MNALVLAMCLGAASATTVPAFTLTFVLIWLGALVVVVNARLLGYRLALLPTVAFIGYCLTPLAGAVLLLMVTPGFWVVRALLTTAGTAWSILSALRLMEMDPALEDRRLLAVYPFCLFFCVVAWLIMVVV